MHKCFKNGATNIRHFQTFTICSKSNFINRIGWWKWQVFEIRSYMISCSRINKPNLWLSLRRWRLGWWISHCMYSLHWTLWRKLRCWRSIRQLRLLWTNIYRTLIIVVAKPSGMIMLATNLITRFLNRFWEAKWCSVAKYITQLARNLLSRRIAKGLR